MRRFMVRTARRKAMAQAVQAVNVKVHRAQAGRGAISADVASGAVHPPILCKAYERNAASDASGILESVAGGVVSYPCVGITIDSL